MTVPHLIQVADVEIWYRVKLQNFEGQYRVYVSSRYKAADRSSINLKETEFNWNYEDMYYAFLEIIYIRSGTQDGIAHDFGKELLVTTFLAMRDLAEEEIIQKYRDYLRDSIIEMLSAEKTELDQLQQRAKQALSDIELDDLYIDVLQRGVS